VNESGVFIVGFGSLMVSLAWPVMLYR